MVRRIRILVLLLVSGVSVAASGADNSASANDESHSSLPDLASESAKKEEQENKGKSFKEQGADYFINSATQGFDNLTPEALESQARSYLQNQITSSAQSYLEGVMSPYGKIRTSLSVGEGGDLDGSSLDYFIPWYDNQSTLFFSQISAQRKEDRTIGNFGLGVRQNVGNWLLGGNAFYDYDFTRGHRRLGLGTEAWTDYLKFSGNYYHPLSDWKDSEDFDFYEERPARGWDFRMESWLPFYPQLGAKLVYEQYYGDEVALFGTDNLQKDPHAVTLGLEYTPVPLVTVGTDYKAGTGDSNDFSVNATVNYQIGTPLAAQLDPENVKIQHSLMGSRTDFVDRNNFIILEYREKDPLDVTLWLKADATNEHPECVIEDTPEAAVGLEKCKWTVNALINHHYKIISASWQAKNNAARTLVMPVVKANALTEGNNNSWNLVLPAWVNADTEEQRTALNTWKVRMTLEDEKGNKQNSGVVEITVQQDRKIELIVDNIADTDRSDHSHEASALADGEDGVVMDLLITDSFGDSTDRNGNELVDDAMTPVLYDSNDKKVTLAQTPCTTETPCVFIASRDKEAGTVTLSSTLPGTFRWKAKADAYGDSNYVDVTFIGDNLSALNAVIYQVKAANPVNLIGKEDRHPTVNNAYRFLLWRDKNKDGVFQMGESIDLTMTVVDRDTQKPLPYRYMELFIDPAKNRKGEHQDAWDNLRVTVDSEGMSASSPEHYTGVTDVNGQAHLTLKHNSGLGVETPIRIVMPDDEGGNVELSFSVIFTVVTSPDVDGANMWGHMRGVVDAGNLYKRPLLAVEASHKDGQFSENNEEWATFNSVASATAQCGVGQVPDQSSLAHLYSEHAGGQMESEHGWPTEDYFIAADSDASGTVHVNLENGDSGKFTDTPNYLTCSANEMVAVLDVYFNDDPVIKNADAKVGEQVKMNIHSRNALNGMAIGNTDFTITMANGKRRDGLTTGFTDTSNGEMQFDDVGYVAGQVYHGITDANGDATIILTQKKGVGLLTPLNIAPVDSLISTPVSRSVKFTVATSPDTAKAKMWGHMADTITVGDWTFERPKLAGEVSNPLRTQDESNETWARVAHSDAVGNPDAGGCAANRLPRIDQLEALYNANSGGKIHSIQGWPTYLNYWSSTYQSATTWKLIALTNGSEFANSNVSIYASCLASDNPVAASITIEPVNPSQWYDGSDVHAVKVKKGETMQLKVTVKDASGNPIPEAPFVLTRGDGYDRRGEKYTAQDGDDLQGIVTPVVIDGESLAWTTTKMGSQTGTDGTRIISVTRPDTHGTRTAINATLYENAAVSASIDTIFTVVTSPDVSVARMWGHMAPSLTAADGAVYQRPLLYAELSSTDNTASKQETNETWAVFHGPASEGANPARCAAGYYPAVEALDSLYSKYPSRTINTAQGWPVYYSYWSGSNSTSFSSGAKLDFYYAVDLADGSRRSENSATSTAWQYQICATTPLPQATQITLTSPQAMDDAIQAVKAKNSESIPLLITTTDAMGNPVPYATFSLKRDAGKARNPDYNKFVATNGTNMTVTPLTGAQQQFYYATSVLTGATGADGTLALTLAEPGGIGLKNQLTANLNDTPTATSSLPVVFTVLTSPDSDKANMYGHMPETFTASNGAEFKRPLVAGEPSSEAHTDTYFETNENWIMVNSFNTGNYGGCPMNQMAAIDDFTALYNDHPSGKVATDIGLPVGKRWWAGDSLLKGSTLYWQYKDLKTGKNYSMSENPGNYYLQLCLTTSRSGLNIALSSDAWNADKSAAVAKKGETIPMTVTVTNDAGQPQAGVAVLLTRDYAYSRGAVDKQYIEPGVIGEPVPFTTSPANMMLTPVAPAGTAVAFNNQNGLSTKWSGFTGDDGKLRFTLTQDKSLGLKTSVTAALANQFDEAASVDAIFTVQTSPDTPYASYWGHMPDTVQVNGVTLRRPYLKAELSAAHRDTWPFNNEFWGTNYYYQSEHVETSLTHLCGSQENIASLDDLKALQSVIGTLQWPTTSSWDYVSQDEGQSNKYYCSFNETTGQTTCTREKATTSGLGSCRVP
ncbi:intimin-like inverse autotransporter SinH [Salmonella enterica]|nr:intimin-like inverse autotransporter SinH [Salmonella enterica]EBM9919121.1 intimin-like inverse autotransporter SinH [Salmonella enterica subsp. enterica serovar Newport]ECM0350208.1 intimin-like inverse autotransporter SinH [Salmonella enterica subsp. enterica serovar Heidelberg]EAB4947323.1 intimin-like inverse autotransporter SinH [Salmonella enterica]EAM5827093.1 intimin-like inverse autotransporter SinH [Salmonella enterica]